MPKISPRSSSNEKLEPGRYVVIATGLKRRTAKSGRDFVALKLEAIHPVQGAAWPNFGCDLSHSFNVKRWEMLAACCKVTVPFEIGASVENTAEEGDRDIRRHFFHKPFVVQIRHKTQDNGYVELDIERFIFDRHHTEEETDAIASHRANASGYSRPEDNVDLSYDSFDDEYSPTAEPDDIPF